ncbi:MAG: hypothetical protein AAFW70_11465 [Cyanobacteria bacterium J06635_10]
MKNKNQITQQTKSDNSIHQEKLRQARAIFKLKFNLLKLSIIASFASILLIYFGDVSVEKVKFGQEIIYRIVLVAFKVTKDANKNLDDENNDE